MAVLKNRAKMSTSTTGAGTITLGSALSGYQSFAAAGVGNGDQVRYTIQDGVNWELGLGTYTASGTTLSRTPSESSGGGSAISLSGNAEVFITAAAEDILSDVVDDTTPQLGGNLDVQTREITTSTSNGNIKITPNGSGVVEVKGAGGNDGTLQLNCSANSHGVKIKSPPHSAGASYTLTLPNNDGSANQSLISDGSGNLSFTTITSNATHTGEVTGSGALTIADNIVDEANLKVSNSPTNGYFLSAQSGNTGGLTWAAAGAALYNANESSPSAQPSATGTNAVAIGDSAVASGNDSVAIGELSRATAQNSFAIGTNNIAFGATGTNSVAVGDRATTTAHQSVALGYNSRADQSQSVAIGRQANTSTYGEIALGGEYYHGVSVRVLNAYNMPTIDGNSGTVLTTNGSGTTTFSPVDDTTKMPLAFGTFTGDVGFNNTESFYDLANSNYKNAFYNPTQASGPKDIFFKTDGTKLYVLDDGNNAIYQYALSTAYDVTTATYENKSLSVASQDAIPYGLHFKDDGTRVFIVGVGSGNLHQYNLSSAWDISTASFSSTATIGSSPVALFFRGTGTQVFIQRGASLYRYPLSSAWDISTLGSTDQNTSLDVDRGMEMSPDGTKIFVTDTNAGEIVRQYNLSSAWDLSTVGSVAATLIVGNTGTGVDDTEIGGLAFNSNGSEMNIVHAGSDYIHKWTGGLVKAKINSAYTLPTADGAAGTAIVTNGSGTLSFATVGAALYLANPSSATDPTAGGTNAVGIGNDAVASGNNSIALGDNATSAGVRSAALTYSHAGGVDSFAAGIGNSSSGRGAQAGQAVAIGNNAYVQATESIGLGYYATIGSSGLRSVALGQSYANGNTSLAAVIANNTSSYGALGANTIAMGYLSKATQEGAVAIGYDAISTGIGSVALGRNCDATDHYATAIGSGNTASQNQAAAVFGESNTASANNALAIGGGSNTASGTYSVAMGESATASTTYAIAIGHGAKALGGDRAMALGRSYASGEDAFAAAIDDITGTHGAKAQHAVAIGKEALADGSSTLALGRDATATSGVYAAAIGRAYASGADSLATAIANNTSSYGATGSNSVAIGYRAKANVTSGISIGSSSVATGTNSVAIGGTLYGGPQAVGSASVVIGQNHSLSSPSANGPGSISLQDGSSTNGNASNSMAVQGASTLIKGQYAYAGGEAGSTAQTSTYVLKRATTDATITTLTTERIVSSNTPSAINQIILRNESAVSFSGTVVVREDATDGDDYAGWEIKGVIMREGAASATTLGVGIVNSLYHTAGLASAVVTLSADTSNGGLKVQVTGIASTNLRWVAAINTSEVTNA